MNKDEKDRVLIELSLLISNLKAKSRIDQENDPQDDSRIVSTEDQAFLAYINESPETLF